MVLIIGGAYQGKLDYAKETYNLSDEDIFDCKENDNSILPSVDFKAKAFLNFHRFVRACVRDEIEAESYIAANIDSFRDKIIIADDVTQGVVPMDKLDRAYREELGRCLVYLGKEADNVIRVFCGIPQVVK